MKKQAIYMLLILFAVIMVSGCGGSKEEASAQSSGIGQIEKKVTGFMDVFKEVAAKEQKDRGKNPLEKAKGFVTGENVLEDYNINLLNVEGKMIVTYKVTAIEIDDEEEPPTAKARVRAQAKIGDETNNGDLVFELVEEKGKWLISEIED